MVISILPRAYQVLLREQEVEELLKFEQLHPCCRKALELVVEEVEEEEEEVSFPHPILLLLVALEDTSY